MKFLAILFFLSGFALAAEKPNVLFLFADDMTWKAVNALSDEDIDTPNLDRLAARGTNFSHAYNSGAWHGAVCVASRTMLNTGLQLWNAKAAEKGLKKDFVETKRTWSQQMSAAGYRTCMSGKWHVGMPTEAIFDEVLHERPGMPSTVKASYVRPVEGQPDTWDPTDKSLGGFWAGGKHWSEVIVDDFETFLGSGDKRPWFMYLAFNATHDPRQAPQEFLDLYPLERMKMPANFLPVYPHRDPMGAPQNLRDEKLAPSPRTEFAVKTHRREYYALVTHLDTQIGRILDRLEKDPGGDNTYIFFTADHGLSCGEHGLMGKQNMYGESVRVPFIVAGPGVPAGKSVDSPIYLQDVMPTSLALAGAGIPESVEFEDLRPLWEGKGTPRTCAYGSYMDSQRMIEKDGKKLILYPKAKVARVFDLAKDPVEKDDLFASPEGKKIASELFPVLLAEQKRFGDPLDLKAIYPEL
jgi:arylsulfatase A-like enzyme